MKNNRSVLLKIYFVFFFLLANNCHSQTMAISDTELINSAELIIIGQLQTEETLSRTESGKFFQDSDVDGHFYSFRVIHYLKGDTNALNIKIFTSKEDESERELGLIVMYEGKDYLLLLKRTKVSQELVNRYRLTDSIYYNPTYSGLSIEDINEEKGLAKLRKTEQYLNIPSFPWRMKTMSDWIELLKIKLQSGYQNDKIGGIDFINSLTTLLAGANLKIQAGDSIGCAKEIQKIGNMIDGANSGFDRIRYVKNDLYFTLSSDLSYSQFLLPEIPRGKLIFLGHLNYLGKTYAGEPGFTLTINGEDFENGATVYWNWSPRVTTFVSSTQLQANITSADIAKPDTATVAVVNPNGATHGAIFIVLPPPSGCNVKLVNSTGIKLTGGALQYYEGSWKDATNNQDGTFSINTTKTTLSLRMTYEYGIQTKSNVSISSDTVVFQTVNAQIQLQNSSGVLIDTGSVQYYAGAWRTLGTTTNGIAAKELLPANYSFRMSYAYASKDKQQDIGTNATVVFQTVNAAVQLQNSSGTLIDTGSVQYYSGAWRIFGTTNNGTTNKELLPNNYSFRMSYAYASKDKQQDIGTNATVVFQTVNAAVQLQNSSGTLMDTGIVQYYSGAWRPFGTTNNGTANKELLSNNYSFRMSYAYANKDKQQDIGTNATVVFQTVNASVQLKNSQGDLMPAPSGDQGTVQYYSGAWRTFGTTTNGTANKELLPNNYSFRMTHQFISLDKAQDISTSSTVSFLTVLCKVKVKNTAGQLIDNAQTSYYSGAWRQIGNTVNGEIVKELLPVNLTFRVNYNGKQQDKSQNISTNNVVEFVIQ